MGTNEYGFKTTGTGRAIHRGQGHSESHPQDGSPISRDAWYSNWPHSKKCNEWVRAFGLTYTLVRVYKPGYGFDFDSHYRITVVGPGGVRADRDFPDELSADDVKLLLWPTTCRRPANVEELNGELLAREDCE